jgi:hypothetical protein
MPATYTLISSVTTGSGATSTIEFASIPQTYTDLVLRISARSNRTTAAYGTMTIQFNSSASNFSYVHLMGYTSGVNSSKDSSFNFAVMGSTDYQTASTFGNADIYIPNYTSSNNKSFSSDYVNENNSGASEAAIMGLVAQLWSNSAAITNIKLGLDGGFTFKQYSTAYLYGISNA